MKKTHIPDESRISDAPETEVTPHDDKEFLTDIAHEMRNALSALRAYTHLLKVEKHGPHSHPQYQRYSTVAHDAAEALVRICDRLLDRDETGAPGPVSPTDATAVSKNTAERYMALAGEKNISLYVQFEPGFPSLPIPQAILEDVLGNLITNAIKFTPSGGTVAVIGKCDPKSGAAIMVIRDTGTGMSPEKLSEVLQFLPVKPAEGSDGELGTGRGLSIMKSQLAPYGVDIEIRSNPNFGTSVALVFQND
ncbi:HAMP domain-containing sensor histidine kinase [Nisaea sp.]|uniref:sensor histidine kinase n=1 Tax=Nisaea sp. TaxID=2024842 RepID=UPI002B26CBE6|nr:HAMP domain-containing sensor histidine kinase [Nisaea sp.]